ncbi:hypothetical protein AAX26_01444 [Aliarcobacter thereius]|uniref:Uncharacterized protein n=2 Tax=Aliarcobacter thereius TaxID=544718 RepID=A0A1C0B641_9BACT|nr:hypothetical protein [Aliarcobacter thereius]OCL86311.1 hypothetical protein AAX26_01444 [Aliarcobacter thereius]OCL96405.1 hypothetical protein AA347_01896 [Aliarcobacter thereius LMG 24486]OCL98634.1 hypothetical protein AAX29_01547 [Aliarcobacter thereius]QBF15634.1 hypothetical protein ATH_0560 [Aliarcobacter thereius LMG 24486]TLS92580.1 hypothetical protein FE244_06505 [Aliarcobacter thereius]
MRYEELITELCEVIKETENDAQGILDNSENMEQILESMHLPKRKKDKLIEAISNIYGFLQRQDLHRQKIERVVNFVCDKNDIDKTQYNLAPIAKNISYSPCCDENMSSEELELLIRSMQG